MPRMSSEQLRLKARANPQRVGVPEAGEEKILRAVRQCGIWASRIPYSLGTKGHIRFSGKRRDIA